VLSRNPLRGLAWMSNLWVIQCIKREMDSSLRTNFLLKDVSELTRQQSLLRSKSQVREVVQCTQLRIDLTCCQHLELKTSRLLKTTSHIEDCLHNPDNIIWTLNINNNKWHSFNNHQLDDPACQAWQKWTSRDVTKTRLCNNGQGQICHIWRESSTNRSS